MEYPEGSWIDSPHGARNRAAIKAASVCEDAGLPPRLRVHDALEAWANGGITESQVKLATGAADRSELLQVAAWSDVDVPNTE